MDGQNEQKILKNILICTLKMHKCLMGLKRHECETDSHHSKI